MNQRIGRPLPTASRLNGTESELLEGLKERFEQHGQSAQRFVDAYCNYCWQVDSIDDFKLAPFHILATEGCVHVQRNHEWHMQTIAKICSHDPSSVGEALQNH